MKSTIYFLTIITISLVLSNYAYSFESLVPLKSPLKTDTPIEEVISALDDYIPEQMEKENVPGLSIAVIKDRTLVWAKGFGVCSTQSSKPVTTSTVFEAASFSKPLSAYLAMLLVDKEMLKLDRSLNSYLPIGYLPASRYSNLITLGHVLSHTSGIGNNILSRSTDIDYEPGTKFSYSGNDYMYMQYVIESITRRGYNDLMTEYLFQPLHMNLSSFVYRNTYDSNVAIGHISTLIFLGIFLILTLCFSILIWLCGRGIRFIIKRQSPLLFERAQVSLIISYFFIISLGIFFLGFSNTLFLTGLIVIAIHSALLNGGHFLIKNIVQRSRLVANIYFRAIVLCYIVFIFTTIFLSWSRSLPIPLRKYSQNNAAASLYTTPTDMSKFLIEVMNGHKLSRESRNKLISPAIRINEYNSWGMGFGIQHSVDGNSFWQHGLNPDFQHLLIGYSNKGIGVVIMTNSCNGLKIVRTIAHKAIGGEHYSYWLF